MNRVGVSSTLLIETKTCVEGIETQLEKTETRLEETITCVEGIVIQLEGIETCD